MRVKKSTQATTTKFDEDCELKIPQNMIKQKGAIRKRTKSSRRVNKPKRSKSMSSHATIAKFDNGCELKIQQNTIIQNICTVCVTGLSIYQNGLCLHSSYMD